MRNKTMLKQAGWIIGGVCLLAVVACGGGGGGTPPGFNPQPDVYNWTGNTRLQVSAANGLLNNDQAGAAITAADTVTALGGSVSVNPVSGAFVYEPPVGAQNTDDSFTYEVTGGNVATVTIHLAERVWFVRNNDTGSDLGTFTAPFLTLAQAEAASDNDDTIFVYQGDGTATGQDAGITLKNGQRLIGKGVGLKVNGVPVINPLPRALISNAALTIPGNSPVVRLATGNEVAGLILLATFNDALLASGGAGFYLHDNTVGSDPVTGRDGIRLLAVTGDTLLLRNTLSAAPGNGIRIANNEDADGNPIAAVPVSCTVTISDSTITNAAQGGVVINFDGAGTQAAVNILSNSVTNTLANDGIAVNGSGGASVTTVASRNVVSGSAALALGLSATDSAIQKAFVANSNLALSGDSSDFRAATQAASTADLCLELLDNGNDAGDESFAAANGGAGVFSLFETENDTPVSQTGSIVPIVNGGCGVPLDGAALFAATCDACHFGNGLGEDYLGIGVANADISNATAAMIEFQLANNPTMAFIRLTPQEVDAIAAALSVAP